MRDHGHVSARSDLVSGPKFRFRYCSLTFLLTFLLSSLHSTRQGKGCHEDIEKPGSVV